MSSAVSELRARFTATMSGFKQAVNGVVDEIQSVGDESVQATNEANKAFDGMKGTIIKLGGVFAGLGTAVAGGMAYAITVTDEYQKALNGVQAQTGLTEEETANLGESMKKIYGDTVTPTFQEIGDTLAYAQKTTGAFGEDLEYLAKDSLLLRDTFGYDMQESIRSADKLMKQFGLTGGDSMGLIASGSQKGLDYAQDLLPTIDEYSVYFKQAGFSAEEMFGLFENAKKNGVFNLDYAGDAIKEFGIIMTEDSDRASEALAQMGLDGAKLRTEFAKGGDSAKGAMKTISEALLNVDDPLQQNIIGVELFGTKFEDVGAKAVVEMLKTNDSIKANTEALDGMNKVKYNTIGEALTGLRRKLEVEVIEPIQTKVMPLVNNMANSLIKNLPAIKKSFSEAFNTIVDGVMKFAPTFESLFTIFKNVGGWLGSTLVVAFSALSSVLSPIVNGITSIVAKFTEWEGFVPILNGIVAGFLAYKTYMLALKAPMLIMTALTRGWALVQAGLNLAMSLNPIGIIIALLVGLGVALYTAYKKSETFRDIVNGAWSAIKAGTKAVIDWFTTTIPVWIENIKNWFIGLGEGLANIWRGTVEGAKTIWSGIVSFFTGLIQGIKNIWNTVSTFFSNLWNGIVSVVKPIIDGFIGGIVTGFTNFVNNVKYILSPILTFFTETWTNIKLMVLSIIGVFLNLITGNFEGLKISLLGIWVAIRDQVMNIITTFKDVAIRLFNVLSSGITNIFNGIKTFAVNTWNGLKTAVVNTVTALKDGAINGFNALKNGAVNTWNNLKTGVVNTVNALKTGAINGVNALKTGFTNAVNNIKNAVVSGFNGAKDGASNAINNMKNSVSNGINSIKNFFTNLKSNVISTVKGINLAQIGRDMIQGLINGISGMIGKVMSTVSNLAKGVTDKIKGILKIKSPSRVFREFGGFIGEGLAIGIDKSRSLVEKTSQGLAESAMIDPVDVGSSGLLAGESLAEQVPSDGSNTSQGSGSGVTTNYQAPLMNIQNYYDNSDNDKREIANGLFRLQQDHDRARGKRT